MAKKVENIHKKAYQCTYFDWREVDMSIGDAYAQTVYADTASKARYSFYLDLSEHYEKEIFMKIKVRRNRCSDLLLREPHAELANLTDEQVKKMKHAIGFHSAVPGHRNYYQVKNDDDWECLVNKGYAEKGESLNLPYFYLTDLGKELIWSLKPYRRGYTPSPE